MTEGRTNGWFEEHVTTSLDRLERGQDHLTKKVDWQGRELAGLKERVKLGSAAWGILGGALPAVGALIYIFVKVV